MSPDRTAQRLRRRSNWRRGGIGALILILISILLDRGGVFGYEGDDWATYDGRQFTIVTVVDGDTVNVADEAGKRTRIRLIGVDAPEMDGPAYWGDKATAYARQRLAGRSVTIKLDGTQSRDRHGRLLAYLYVTDSDNFNLGLVRDGQAYADRRHAHSLRSLFETAEAEARRKAVGLWKAVGDDQQPAWRRRWLEERRQGRR